jgi:hypothetical protein
VIYAVEVGVALARPPRVDAVKYVLVEAESQVAARLLACQIAAADPRVVMPVSDEIVDLPGASTTRAWE